MRHRIWIVAGLVLCGLALVAFVPLNHWKEPLPTEVTLSDGTIVRFEKVFVGTTSYDSYSRIKGFLTDYVPKGFQSRMSDRIKTTFSIQPNHLGVLFSTWTKDGKRKQDSPQFLSRMEFVESTGYVFDSPVTGQNASYNLKSMSNPAFPRRDPILHIRLYELGTDRRLFDLSVPNPGYQPRVTEWSPETIPITKTLSPLTVTLKRGPAEFKHQYLSDDDIEIKSTDPRWILTRPKRHFWSSDTTGNTTYVFPGLSPYEPVWKLNVRLWRSSDAEFSADEVWKTQFYPLPSSSKVERLDLKKTLLGVEVEVPMLAPAGTVQDDGTTISVEKPTPNAATGISMEWGSGKGIGPFRRIHSGLPFIPVIYSAVDEETELILTIRDQNGTKLSLDNGGTYGMNGSNMRIVQFEPKPESTDVQLEVIVNKGRTVEFFVTPPKPGNRKDVQPGNAASNTAAPSDESSNR
ncbi:MAG: hypothetical protein WCH39_15700 [Schlesneria sp.]